MREWLLAAGGKAAVAAQCVAVSTNEAAMDEFGIAPDRRLAMWDWVGGRYSVWSAVGLDRGARDRLAEVRGVSRGRRARWTSTSAARRSARNLPVLLALLGVWNRNFLGAPSHAVLPYDDHLARFPAYLAAARDGEQRQVGAARRRARRVRDVPGDLG